MKKKILVLLVMVGVILAATASAAASDWEMTGGFSIINVTLDKWNSTIDDLNSLVDGNFNVLIPTTNVDEMDNIEKVPMLSLGAEKALSDKWSARIEYEYIFGAVETEFESFNGASYVDNEGEIKVDLHGIAFLTDYSLNDNWSLGGGVGFYKGTKSKKLTGPAFTAASLAADEDYDLDAVSYRFGVNYQKEISTNWDFNAGLDYLYMELDDEDEGNVYSKGLIYNLAVSYNF